GITITAANDAPVNNLGGSPISGATPDQITTPGVALDFSSAGGNQLSVSDVDAGGATTVSTTLSLGAGQGTLTANGQTNTSLTFTGSLSTVNAAIATV